MDEANIVRHLFRELRGGSGIECESENLGLGNMCKTVYPARRGDEKLVVKFGIGEDAALEVERNIVGYEELRSMGAARLIPPRVQVLEVSGIKLLIMSDCGPDFVHASRKAQNPVELYEQLVRGMRVIYEETLTDTPCVLGKIRDVRELLVQQCTTYLQGRVNEALLRRVHEYNFDALDSVRSCFSSYDFTPEDVFITSEGVKYVDPIPGQLGCPVIDLACFAGVARDAHALPGSVSGYEVLERFATEELPSILHLSPKEAIRLFALGRALQSALSARFRLESDPQQAERHVHACNEQLARVVQR